ncbi:MAG: response regulator transcription factor [Actinomycetota bacterium]
MATIVLLSDRFPDEALAAIVPALAPTDLDLKIQPLSLASLGDALQLGPEALLVDAAENPGQGFSVLRRLRERTPRSPAIAIVERRDLERFRWEEIADEVLYPSAPEAEIRLRIAMLRRRAGGSEGSAIRLGPMVLDVDSYKVTVAGRSLDLTFKEFELMRFLASRPGRVFTRPALLREVWGYDFYGGTRTVDVHVRRLRSKLGPEHESLIETVRGVGYRAADL